MQTLYFPFFRKAGGRCGFAESMPHERITALKMDETPVEMTDVSDAANDIVEKAEAPPQTYPLLSLRNKRVFVPFLYVTLPYYVHWGFLTIHTRVPSPVVPVPGVGQVGQGLQNTWGLEEEEDEEEEEENDSGAEQEEKVTKMEEEQQEKKESRGGILFGIDAWGYFSLNNLRTHIENLFWLAGDVVEISDSEEEEVVILHPETDKAPKYVYMYSRV